MIVWRGTFFSPRWVASGAALPVRKRWFVPGREKFRAGPGASVICPVDPIVPYTPGGLSKCEVPGGRRLVVSVIRVTQGDERYEALSQGFNQRWVARPDTIALVSSTSDVVEVVEEAVRGRQRISVRSGGHCYENFVCNDEVKVIVDVSGLDQVSWDERRGAYCLGAGATNWRLDTHLYRRFGVAVPGGSCYSVGVGGHISAGGGVGGAVPSVGSDRGLPPGG